MPTPSRTALLRYGTPVITVGLALLVTLQVDLLAARTPFALFFAAVMVSTWYGGRGPGLLSIALAALVSDYFIIPPLHSLALSRDNILQLGTFILVALLINWLTAARQQSEKTLRESERRFRLLVEGVKDYAIYTLDARGRVASWNVGAQRLKGYRAEEVLGKHFSLFFTPEGIAQGRPQQLLKRAAEEGRGAGEGWRIRKDGTLFWADVVITALRDEAGGLIGFSKLTRDATERRRAEEELRQAVTNSERDRAQLEAVFQAVGEGIVVSDAAGNFAFVNEAEARMNGYASPEEMKQNIAYFAEVYELYYPDGRPVPVEDWPLSKALRGESFAERELRGRRKDTGQEWFFSFSGEPVRDERGETILAVIVTRDITERKRSEQALQESERRYRELVENAKEIIYTHDLAGRFTSLNKAGEEITGYTCGEDLVNVMDLIAPEYRETARRQMMEKVAGRERGSYEIEEIEIITKDQRRVSLEVSSRLIYKNGVPVGVQGIARDITERRQLEEQLRQSQKLESVGQLAGGVAHDFNNLLTVITGYSQLLLGRSTLDEAARSKVEEIKKAADRAAALTQQLLAFSRKQVLEPRVIDLNDVVADTDKLLRRLIGEDIHLVTLRGPGLWRVKADPGQLSQVIINLAVNARDAMPQGGKLTIETKNVYLDGAYARRHAAVVPGAYVLLAVSDTGTGMDEETLEHIFEPFFTTKEQGKGTGLGLAMVYGIVKQSGGNVWVYSEPGQGTTFKIYLPRVEEDVAETQAVALPKSPRGTETVLLVEDEEMVRNLVRDILESEGYTVRVAADGNEALRVCERHQGPIHLLVTDVVMPGMSGRQLVERLKEKCRDVKVLYMSGYTDDAIVHHGVLDAGTNFLQKPFTPDAVARKVREVLDGQR